jgi:hypothetical protein
MFEPINRKSPEDRRSVHLDPASIPTIKQGQILEVDAADGYAKLADGAAVVAAPLWAFTKSSRLDVSIAKAVTVLEAPFLARVDTDGYAGSPTAKAALAVGTAGNVGKLVVVSVTADATTLQKVVAYCTKAPDADGVMEFKAIR